MSSSTNRALAARIAAHARWAAATPEKRRQGTQAARDAIDARLLADLDPDGTLPDDERDERLRNARSAYYARLASRRRKAGTIDPLLASEILDAAEALAHDQGLDP